MLAWGVVAIVVGVAATLVGAVQLSRELWRRWQRPELRREDLPITLAVVVGLLLRLGAHASPHDLNDRLYAVYWDTWPSGFHYGLGMPAWAWLVTRFAPDAQDAIFHANAVVGTLTIALVAAWVRARHERPVAYASAWLVAAAPLLVRFGHTDVQVLVETAQWFLAAVLLQTPGRSRALLAGLVLGAAAHQRPESVLMVAALLAWMWVERRDRRWWREEGVAVLLGAGLVAVPWLLTLLPAVLAVVRGDPGSLMPSQGGHPLLHWGPTHFVFLDPAFTAPVAIGLGLGGLLLCGRREGLFFILCIGGLASLNTVSMWSSAGGEAICLARHQLRLLPWIAVLQGMAAVWVAGRVGKGAAVWWGVLVVSMLAALPVAYRPTLLDTEHAFLRRTLSQLPDGCRILALRRPMDASLMPQPHYSILAGRDHQWLWVDDGTEPIPDGDCVVWYRPALCHAHFPPGSAPEGAMFEPCEVLESRLSLRPRVVQSLEAVPPIRSWFSADPVEVGLFDVVR